MQIVAVSIPQASSFTSQQVSIVHILPCYWVTLSHFDYWDVGSLLGHTQDKPYSHDVRFPSTYLFIRSSVFLPHLGKIQVMWLIPETPGQMGTCP